MTQTRTPQPSGSSRHPRTPRGFSLIELLVVISVIGLLAGIGFVAARAMMAQAKIEQANAVVSALAGVPTEILASTDQPLRYMDYTGRNARAYPNDPVDPTVRDAWDSINFLIERGDKNPTAKAMLQSVNREFFKYGSDPEDVSEHYIVDPWGQPLRFSAFSNNGTPGDPSDDFYGATNSNNGTGDYRGDYGMPKRRTPYVASAGPDGLWGEFDGDGLIPDADAADNIYSFELQ